jgi:hypothetical protein
MRDPARIKRILEKLEIVWNKDQDMRFGQLATCLTPKNTFYFEDDLLEARLDELISGKSWDEVLKN